MIPGIKTWECIKHPQWKASPLMEVAVREFHGGDVRRGVLTVAVQRSASRVSPV